MANHTDEHGRSTPAKSKVAKKMRVALRGQKNVHHKAVAKIYAERKNPAYGARRDLRLLKGLAVKRGMA